MSAKRSSGWGIRAVALGLVLLGASSARASGTSGDLDVGFGTAGAVTAPDQQASVVVARGSDGAVATGGFRAKGSFNNATTYGWVIRQYTAVGQVDTSFAGGGPFTRFGDYGTDQVYALAFDASGRILAAGNVVFQEVSGSGRRQTISYVARGVVLRLNIWGGLDTTFGTGGQVVLGFPVHAMAALPGGKILVAGPSNGDPATARLLSDGTLDATYGSGGVSVDARSADACGRVMGVAVQSTGAAVLAWRGSHTVKSKVGTTTVQVWHVTRMTAMGSPDSTFASAERADRYTGGLVVGPDDRVFATGATVGYPASVVVTAANANGAPDLSFGTAGESTWTAHATQISVGAPVLQSDGALVVPSHFSDGAWRAAPVRLLADGTLDASFGAWGEGDALSLGTGVQTRTWGLALAPDGGILMVGDYVDSPVSGSYVARYVP
jgi:uncharacterized delta-60 repeat protein